jgi:hypothetical protein
MPAALNNIEWNNHPWVIAHIALMHLRALAEKKATSNVNSYYEEDFVNTVWALHSVFSDEEGLKDLEWLHKDVYPELQDKVTRKGLISILMAVEKFSSGHNYEFTSSLYNGNFQFFTKEAYEHASNEFLVFSILASSGLLFYANVSNISGHIIDSNRLMYNFMIKANDLFISEDALNSDEPSWQQQNAVAGLIEDTYTKLCEL